MKLRPIASIVQPGLLAVATVPRHFYSSEEERVGVLNRITKVYDERYNLAMKRPRGRRPAHVLATVPQSSSLRLSISVVLNTALIVAIRVCGHLAMIVCLLVINICLLQVSRAYTIHTVDRTGSGSRVIGAQIAIAGIWANNTEVYCAAGDSNGCENSRQ